MLGDSANRHGCPSILAERIEAKGACNGKELEWYRAQSTDNDRTLGIGHLAGTGGRYCDDGEGDARFGGK
jgi:hypothetical protein